MHLGVAGGLLKAARRARQIGCTAIQIFSDNPTAWRRRPEPPADAPAFVAYCASEGIAPIAIHASYLINLAGSAEPFASQSREGLIYELQRAPAYGATLVNTHIGSHRGSGRTAGRRRLAENVAAILAEAPSGVRLVLENSAGGGDTIGSSVEELAGIMDDIGSDAEGVAFCLDTAHLWGAGYDISTAAGASAVIDRFEELIGIDRLALRPPQRLALDARLSHGQARARGGGTHRSVRAPGAPSGSAAGSRRHRVHDGNARAWTRATTRSTCGVPVCCTAGRRRFRRCRRRRSGSRVGRRVRSSPRGRPRGRCRCRSHRYGRGGCGGSGTPASAHARPAR